MENKLFAGNGRRQLRPMSKQAPTVCVDLDSTLCDTRHRHYLIREGEFRHLTDWTAYSMACEEDLPVIAVIEVVRRLEMTNNIVILSGRSAKAMDLTLNWLMAHRVPADGIILRPETSKGSNEDFKKAEILRLNMVANSVDPKMKVSLMIDDWPPVAASLAGIGIMTVTVTPPGLELDRAAHAEALA
jgi:hypothetical protein